jgi:hypothetical protein
LIPSAISLQNQAFCEGNRILITVSSAVVRKVFPLSARDISHVKMGWGTHIYRPLAAW